MGGGFEFFPFQIVRISHILQVYYIARRSRASRKCNRVYRGKDYNGHNEFGGRRNVERLQLSMDDGLACCIDGRRLGREDPALFQLLEGQVESCACKPRNEDLIMLACVNFPFV